MSLKPLSQRQELRLTEFLDDKFIDITRNFRKRFEPSSPLHTLPGYISAVQSVLSLILQIPPTPPSESLRVSLLLRLTNDVLESIPGYLPDLDHLPEVLDFLDDLDQAWVTVIRHEAWKPHDEEDSDVDFDDIEQENVDRPSPLSQTDKVRLDSILMNASIILANWVAHRHQPEEPVIPFGSFGELEGFGRLFANTLEELDEVAENSEELDNAMDID